MKVNENTAETEKLCWYILRQICGPSSISPKRRQGYYWFKLQTSINCKDLKSLNVLVEQNVVKNDTSLICPLGFVNKIPYRLWTNEKKKRKIE